MLACPILHCLFCFNAACSHQGLILTLLAHPVFTSVAELTYATYLSQWLVFDFMAYDHWDPSQATFVVFELLMCFLMGAAVHNLVEEPFAPVARRWLRAKQPASGQE